MFFVFGFCFLIIVIKLVFNLLWLYVFCNLFCELNILVGVEIIWCDLVIVDILIIVLLRLFVRSCKLFCLLNGLLIGCNIFLLCDFLGYVIYLILFGFVLLVMIIDEFLFNIGFVV